MNYKEKYLHLKSLYNQHKRAGTDKKTEVPLLKKILIKEGALEFLEEDGRGRSNGFSDEMPPEKPDLDNKTVANIAKVMVAVSKLQNIIASFETQKSDLLKRKETITKILKQLEMEEFTILKDMEIKREIDIHAKELKISAIKAIREKIGNFSEELEEIDSKIRKVESQIGKALNESQTIQLYAEKIKEKQSNKNLGYA